MRRGMWGLVLLGLVLGVACSSAGGSSGNPGGGQGGTAGDAAAGTGGTAGSVSGGSGGSGGIVVPDSGDDAGTGGSPAPDPKTCAEAATTKSYVGCEFWPTVLANPVWSIFDFAVAVANSGTELADVTVTRGAKTWTAQVQPNGLSVIYLDWVPELKGPDADVCASGTPPKTSVRVDGGAYKLVSTRPVTVWQFNALEFQATGGPAGKDWTNCPGTQPCSLQLGIPVGCFAFTADASLLLPVTAMTGNYRVMSFPSWAAEQVPSYVGVTATKDGTKLKVQVSGTGEIMAGTGVTATAKNGVLTLDMNAGDVVELVNNFTQGSDLSGSLVQADKPVQVIAGSSCMEVPNGIHACDHLEESLLPAETLGKHYFVTRPTGPNGTPVAHVVRLYGNKNGTKLTYPSGTPLNAPAAIGEGQVFDMGLVNEDFEVQADNEFGVAMFQQGGAAVDPLAAPGTRKGDPSQSHAAAVEQWRLNYIFVAPNDYAVSYVDVLQPMSATIVVDGAPGIAPIKIGTSAFGVARVKLNGAAGGVHVITGDAPFGIQVLGYAPYTSYQYPGGLALQLIAPPPEPIP